MVSSDNDDEEYDSFAADAPDIVFDPDSLALVRDSIRAGSGGGSRASRSAATTQLASDVGSVVGARKNPFLKSITFFHPKIYYRGNGRGEKVVKNRDSSPLSEVGDDGACDNNDNLIDGDIADDVTFEINDLTHWEIRLNDPLEGEFRPRKIGIRGKLSKVSDSFKRSKRPQLIVQDFEGLVEFSSLEAGDRLVSINKKKIKADEFLADEAMLYMRQCLEKDGVLHVTTENPQGQDIIINVTVIKPRSEMTYEDLGLIVWNWPHLCVKEIKKDSIFKHTALQETDQIAAINDIECGNMRETAFAKCVKELPAEITITLIRRKHRYSGSYV